MSLDVQPLKQFTSEVRPLLIARPNRKEGVLAVLNIVSFIAKRATTLVKRLF
jgi:hypothetical protein